MSQSPFFIIGAPRSGTTMLQMALNRHSRVIIPPETHFFTLATRSRSGQLRHWKRIQDALGIDTSPPSSRIAPGATAEQHFARITEAYSRSINKQIEFLGEKSPEHQLRVSEILQTFPKAKFVLIYRDGRDVALSLSKAPWMPNSLEAGFLVWLHFYRIQRRLVADLPEQVHCVRYESIVAEPRRELEAVSSFLGIEYEPQMADGHGNRDGVRDDEYHKARAFERIMESRVGTCSREVGHARRLGLERWGGWALRELDYEVHAKNSFPVPSVRILSAFSLLTAEVAIRAVQRTTDDVLGTSFYHANRRIREDTGSAAEPVKSPNS